MAKRKKRHAAPIETPEQRAEREAAELKRARTKKIVWIILLCVAAVCLVAAIVIAIIVSINQSRTVDYMNDDLGNYIYISEDDYKNMSVEVKLDPVDDMSIDAAIAKAQYARRVLESAYNGKYYTKLPTLADGSKRRLAVGDLAYIYYLGFYDDEDGERVYFDGGCNFDGDEPHELGLGSGSFITGFELGIVGADPEEYSPLGRITSRDIKEGDFISFTYTVVSSSSDNEKNAHDVTVMMSVDPEDVDAKYGVGFSDFLVGKRAGEIEGDFTTVLDGDKVIYSDMKIGAVYDLGDNPLTVDARFPANYSEESLAGKTVKYYVYVDKAQLYTVPEVNEEFIKKQTGLDAEGLMKYGDAGDSLDECYRAYLKEALTESAKAAASDDIVAAFWEQLDKITEIKMLPEGEVLLYYNDYIADIESSYENQSAYYSSFDEFVTTMLLIEDAKNWKQHVRERAELAVAEKIGFYYIIRREGFLPNDEEYEREYERVVSEMLDYVLESVKCYPEDYDSEEEYLADVAEYKKLMLEGYGDKYFEENVIYEFAMEKIKSMIKVKYV